MEWGDAYRELPKKPAGELRTPTGQVIPLEKTEHKLANGSVRIVVSVKHIKKESKWTVKRS